MCNSLAVEIGNCAFEKPQKAPRASKSPSTSSYQKAVFFYSISIYE